MRVIFLIVLLAGAVFYSYVAFADLGFLTRTGRLGPGFFPRVIGVSTVAFLLWAVIDELRTRAAAEGSTEQWRDVLTITALAIGYAVLLRLVGGFVATLVFLLGTLSVLNPGRHLQNAAIAVVVPVAVYLLFDRLLNANLPPALFDLPI